MFVAEEELTNEARGMLPIKRSELDSRLEQQQKIAELAPAARLDTFTLDAELTPQGNLVGNFVAEVATQPGGVAYLSLLPCNLALAQPVWREARTQAIYRSRDSKTTRNAWVSVTGSCVLE